MSLSQSMTNLSRWPLQCNSPSKDSPRSGGRAPVNSATTASPDSNIYASNSSPVGSEPASVTETSRMVTYFSPMGCHEGLMWVSVKAHDQDGHRHAVDRVYYVVEEYEGLHMRSYTRVLLHSPAMYWSPCRRFCSRFAILESAGSLSALRVRSSLE